MIVTPQLAPQLAARRAWSVSGKAKPTQKPVPTTKFRRKV